MSCSGAAATLTAANKIPATPPSLFLLSSSLNSVVLCREQPTPRGMFCQCGIPGTQNPEPELNLECDGFDRISMISLLLACFEDEEKNIKNNTKIM